MSVKSVAQAEARQLRKKHPELTVNVREITRGNWGIRFSSKGKKDTWRPGCYTSHSGKVVCPSRRKRGRLLR